MSDTRNGTQVWRGGGGEGGGRSGGGGGGAKRENVKKAFPTFSGPEFQILEEKVRLQYTFRTD